MHLLRRSLQVLATTVLLSALTLWVVTGANRGWTKNSVPVKTVDEVLGIEGIHYEKRFVPGVDFLGAAFLTSSVLAGVSLLFRRRNNSTH